jgi:3-phosphoshikimate 1-carboxyvinyltransferase
MIYKLSQNNKNLVGNISIVPSKSESNRVLLIRALCNDSLDIQNLSDSNDTLIMEKALDLISQNQHNSKELIINIEDCGTAMRFLSAYLSMKEGKYLLTGSERMKQRPIGILAEALKGLGAKISYAGVKYYPPLLIEGGELKKDKIEVDSNVSSQFISALLIIAPYLPKGLKIVLKGKSVSKPYIKMTLEMMKHFGVSSSWTENTISILPQNYKKASYTVGGDWTAASYWYELSAFAERVNLKIEGLLNNGIQGDAVITELFEKFGVVTKFENNNVSLSKKNFYTDKFEFDFTDNPDLAQTLGVTCAGLNMKCQLNGIENLSIKETDRSNALTMELKKIGFDIANYSGKKIVIYPSENKLSFKEEIKTYNDHRMALAFAPLCMRFGEIIIENPEVVNKSYPSFWKQLEKMNFKIEKLSD